MTMQTIRYAAHDAILDPMTGTGLLVMPRPHEDVYDPFDGRTLHSTAWRAVVADLQRRGWDVTDDGEGCWVEVGVTRHGRQVLALVADDAVIDHPSVEDLMSAERELCELVGVR